MNIAIVGGGWVGCHLAKNLRKVHDVVLFDKHERLFLETSYNNQNRLHKGFHYARNSKTRELCEHTFNQFCDDYKEVVVDVPNNYYCVPFNSSIIDFGTFEKIFHDYTFHLRSTKLQNVEGCVAVDEKYIDFKKAHEYFNNTLGDIFVQKDIESLDDLKDEFDVVINCTNNHIPDPSCTTAFYELTITLLYDKHKHTEFGALTLVDGEFFSIYPYQDTTYTVSDVTNTPIKRFNSVTELRDFQVTEDIVKEKIKQFEDKIMFFYPQFKDDFSYSGYFLSTKAKFVSESANRYPFLSQQDNVINCFTGKIQGIYVIEDYVKNEIHTRRNRSSR